MKFRERVSGAHALAYCQPVGARPIVLEFLQEWSAVAEVGMAQIYQTVQNQASALSYLDVFHVLMVIGGAMFFLSFLLQGNKPKKQAIAAH
jgi:hypothetical protein